MRGRPDDLYFGKDANQYLNGTAAYAIDYRGDRWPTVRHAYEAEKFLDELLRESIRRTKSVEEAKDLSRREKARRRKGWNLRMKRHVLGVLMRELFNQHPHLLERLLATKKLRLVCRSHSLFWGTDKNGEGMNARGLVNMRVRSYFQKILSEGAAE